jgi:protein-disulfide isomerase
MSNSPSHPSRLSVSSETITLKRSHFLAFLFAFVLLIGIVLGYAAALMINRSPVSTTVAQGPEPQSMVTVVPPTADNDPAWGPENAKVTIIEFSDFQCPYCKQFFDNTYRQLKVAYSDRVRFVYRDFPVASNHPEAQAAAEAAECANDQGRFWEYHDALFSNQDKLQASYYFELATQLGLDQHKFSDCLRSGKYTDEVAQDFGAGLNAGVTGTPTFFINGRIVVGAQPYQTFKQIIDQELSR